MRQWPMIMQSTESEHTADLTPPIDQVATSQWSMLASSCWRTRSTGQLVELLEAAPEVAAR